MLDTKENDLIERFCYRTMSEEQLMKAVVQKERGAIKEMARRAAREYYANHPIMALNFDHVKVVEGPKEGSF